MSCISREVSLQCALLLDDGPPEEASARPFQTPLKLGDPNYPSST